jgi:hypothetical protein
MALTKEQLKIIYNWIRNEEDETKILKKYRITYKKWAQWLNDENVRQEIKGKVLAAKTRSKLFLARYLPLASAKLIELCNSDNYETSRKACIEILNFAHQNSIESDDEQIDAKDKLPNVSEFDSQTQSKLLAVLAESKKR